MLNKIEIFLNFAGAHMSGYAGYYLQRDFELKLGRITGCDPAKPYFEVNFPHFLHIKIN